MTEQRKNEIRNLAEKMLKIADNYLQNSKVNQQLQKSLSEGAEIPGYEERKMKLGQFENREFVAMMTDIRKSTEIINSENGVEKMFKIFYVYSAVIANIVDNYGGTSTEFLGDGVINLFPIDQDRDKALENSMMASWEILIARENIMNPIFYLNDLPQISLGIGIDYGMTIITKFGYRNDHDLKAFGKCVYRVSKLCKGVNEIFVGDKAKVVWPSKIGGSLHFTNPINIEGHTAFKASTL